MTVTVNITRRTAVLILAVVAALAFVVTVAGCSNKQQQPFNDAPRTATQNSDPAQIIAMPDGFNNAASKCDGPNRIYTTYHGDSSYGGIAVVANDPRCTGTKP